MMFLFFFFKQKTAYEMRISDWSSDVCSSVWSLPFRAASSHNSHKNAQLHHVACRDRGLFGRWPRAKFLLQMSAGGSSVADRRRSAKRLEPALPSSASSGIQASSRSEEHTSELQSLMRHSYAVFCLKKKNKQKNNQITD